MYELLVGLPEVDVRGVLDEGGGPLRVHVESQADQRWCRQCDHAQVKDRSAVEFVDLACFGRPTRLVWHTQRRRCPEASCPAGSWTVVDPHIA